MRFVGGDKTDCLLDTMDLDKIGVQYDEDIRFIPDDGAQNSFLTRERRIVILRATGVTRNRRRKIVWATIEVQEHKYQKLSDTRTYELRVVLILV